MIRKSNIWLMFFIMVTLIGCPNEDPDQNVPGPTKVGSIASLQSVIDNAKSGSVLDLSQCQSGTSMNFDVSKSLTLQNGDNLGNCDFNISSSGVTIKNSTIGNVTTSGNGSSNLKIANSSLSSLTLSGVGRGEGRGESEPVVTLVGSTVTVEVTLNEVVELRLENFASNIAKFAGRAAATIRMHKDAFEKEKEKIRGWLSDVIMEEGNMFDDDYMFDELDKAGPAGKRLQYKSGYFPIGAARYVANLVKKCVSVPNFPAVSTDECQYFMLTANDFYKEMGISFENAIDGRILEVKIPESNFNPTAYKRALKESGFIEEDGNFTVENLQTKGNIKYIFNIKVNDTPKDGYYSICYFSFRIDVREVVRNVIECFFTRKYR